MKLYVERMIKERDDLKGKIKKAKAALETMFAAVLAAKDTDNGKTLQIDSNGKVALVTV
jgi:hypothetical protein